MTRPTTTRVPLLYLLVLLTVCSLPSRIGAQAQAAAVRPDLTVRGYFRCDATSTQQDYGSVTVIDAALVEVASPCSFDRVTLTTNDGDPSASSSSAVLSATFSRGVVIRETLAVEGAAARNATIALTGVCIGCRCDEPAVQAVLTQSGQSTDPGFDSSMTADWVNDTVWSQHTAEVRGGHADGGAGLVIEGDALGLQLAVTDSCIASPAVRTTSNTSAVAMLGNGRVAGVDVRALSLQGATIRLQASLLAALCFNIAPAQVVGVRIAANFTDQTVIETERVVAAAVWACDDVTECADATSTVVSGVEVTAATLGEVHLSRGAVLAVARPPAGATLVPALTAALRCHNVRGAIVTLGNTGLYKELRGGVRTHAVLAAGADYGSITGAVSVAAVSVESSYDPLVLLSGSTLVAECTPDANSSSSVFASLSPRVAAASISGIAGGSVVVVDSSLEATAGRTRAGTISALAVQHLASGAVVQVNRTSIAASARDSSNSSVVSGVSVVRGVDAVVRVMHSQLSVNVEGASQNEARVLRIGQQPRNVSMYVTHVSGVISADQSVTVATALAVDTLGDRSWVFARHSDLTARTLGCGLGALHANASVALDNVTFSTSPLGDGIRTVPSAPGKVTLRCSRHAPDVVNSSATDLAQQLPNGTAGLTLLRCDQCATQFDCSGGADSAFRYLGELRSTWLSTANQPTALTPPTPTAGGNQTAANGTTPIPPPPAPTSSTGSAGSCDCVCFTFEAVSSDCVLQYLFVPTFLPFALATVSTTESESLSQTDVTASVSSNITATGSLALTATDENFTLTIKPPTRSPTRTKTATASDDITVTGAEPTETATITPPPDETPTATMTRTPPPTTSPSLSLVAGLPPRPSGLALALNALGASQVVQDVAVYVAAASAAASGLLVVTHGTKGANVARIAQVVDCGFSEHWLKPPLVDVLYHAPVGQEGDDLRYLKGAILTTLLMATTPQVIVVAILHRVPHAVRVRSILGIVAVLCYAYFLPACVSASTLVAIHARVELDRTLGAVGLAAALVALGLPIVALTRMPSVYLAFRMFDRGARRYDKPHIRFYVLEDIAVAMMIAITVASGPADVEGTGCVGIGVAVAAIALGHLLYLLWLRPFAKKLLNVCAVILAIGQLVLAVLALGAAAVSGDTLGYVGFAAITQMLMLPAQLLVMFVWYTIRLYRRRFNEEDPKPSWLEVEEQVTVARHGKSKKQLERELKEAEEAAKGASKLHRRPPGGANSEEFSPGGAGPLLILPNDLAEVKREKQRRAELVGIDIADLVPDERRPKAATGPTQREVVRALSGLYDYQTFGHGTTLSELGSQYNLHVDAVNPHVMAAIAGPQQPVEFEAGVPQPPPGPPPASDRPPRGRASQSGAGAAAENPLDIGLLNPEMHVLRGRRHRKSDRFRPPKDNDDDDDW